jgi:hypothetical protein
VSRSGRPAAHLVRHFVSGLFDLGFLSEAGSASFKRTMLGVATVLLSLGLLLARVYIERYGALADEATAEPYHRALLGDHALLIALPMWIGSVVTVLIGHALFPDETDFRVLMALPLTRRDVFLAKLGAVALFVGGFALAAHLALVPLFLLTSLSAWAEGAFLVRACAYLAASVLASAFATLAVVAVHGLCLMVLPRGHVLTFSAMSRSVLLCGLVLAVPGLLQLPATGTDVVGGAAWISWAPPFWFLGLERAIAGESGGVATLAGHALIGLCLAALLAALSYGVLYQQFDRMLLRTGGAPGGGALPVQARPRRRRRLRRPAFSAVSTFVSLTLRRSVLHQGILVVLMAGGVGWALSGLMGAGVVGWLLGGGPADRDLANSLSWWPFALLLIAIVAVRATLVVPFEPRSNWLFRMTETPAARGDQLEAAAWTVRRYGVLLPIALMAPLQAAALGWGVVPLVVVELVWGTLAVEMRMHWWRIIPFTSSYLPGKEFLPLLLLKAGIAYLLFTLTGFATAQLLRRGSFVGIVVTAIALAATAWLWRERRTAARMVPLAFEDLPPEGVQTLGLSGD